MQIEIIFWYLLNYLPGCLINIVIILLTEEEAAKDQTEEDIKFAPLWLPCHFHTRVHLHQFVIILSRTKCTCSFNICGAQTSAKNKANEAAEEEGMPRIPAQRKRKQFNDAPLLLSV